MNEINIYYKFLPLSFDIECEQEITMMVIFRREKKDEKKKGGESQRVFAEFFHARHVQGNANDLYVRISLLKAKGGL